MKAWDPSQCAPKDANALLHSRPSSTSSYPLDSLPRPSPQAPQCILDSMPRHSPRQPAEERSLCTLPTGPPGAPVLQIHLLFIACMRRATARGLWTADCAACTACAPQRTARGCALLTLLQGSPPNSAGCAGCHAFGPSVQQQQPRHARGPPPVQQPRQAPPLSSSRLVSIVAPLHVPLHVQSRPATPAPPSAALCSGPSSPLVGTAALHASIHSMTIP